MILDFRYHIFTITAIFAALGLGILIGTSIIGNEGLIKEQRKIINNIGQDIEELKNENVNLKQDITELRSEIDYRVKLEKKLLTLSLKDELQGRNYLFYSTVNKKESLTEVRKIFELAGAGVNIVKKPDELKKINKSKIKEVVLWNPDKINSNLINEFKKNHKNDIIISHDKSLIGMMLTLLESEMDGINNNSGLQ